MRSLHRFHRRAFTLLEVAFILVIIGLMLAMIIGYLMAPKDKGPLPPIENRKSAPLVRTPAPATPPAASAPVATPAPTATPVKSIDLSPGAVPAFR